MTRASLLILLDELPRLEGLPEEREAIEEEILRAIVELELGERRVRRGAPLS